MNLRAPFFFLAGVLVVQAIALIFGLYGVIPALDVPMHFAGGFGVAMLGIAIHHRNTDKHHMGKGPDWYHILFVLSFTMLIAVAWEFHEYVLDNTLAIWLDLGKAQVSISDTMLDLALGGLGGISAFFLFKKGL